MARAQLAVGRILSLVLAAARNLGSRPARAVLLLGLAGGGGSVIVGLIQGPPLPAIHDEFSYLLAADTYASGRLTNPPHPLWQHFETFHVLQQPTYQSKYPPGQGLLLAIGIRVFDEPAVGVWIGAGLMAAALTWALMVWLPTGWGLLISLMVTAQLGWFTYWAQSFWGGSLAATGGALLFGGIGVLLRRPTRMGGVAVGTGMSLLVLTRPFEGALASVALLAALMVRKGFDREAWSRLVRRGGLVYASVILAICLGWTAYYHLQVTGSPTTLPYQVHEAEYGSAPSFLFQSRGEFPSYRHEELERYWREWGAARHDFLSRGEGQLERQARRLWYILVLFLGAGLLALAGLALRQPRLEGAAIPASAAGLVLLGVLATLGGYGHYAAPAVAPIACLAGIGMARLHRLSTRRKILDPAGLILAGWMVMIGVQMSQTLGQGIPRMAVQRQVVKQVLAERPGKHLVMVEYGESHNYHMEWVYNRADIDGARIVWARSMGPEKDANLRAYFPERTAWTLTVDEEVRLLPADHDP